MPPRTLGYVILVDSLDGGRNQPGYVYSSSKGRDAGCVFVATRCTVFPTRAEANEAIRLTVAFSGGEGHAPVWKASQYHIVPVVQP